MRDREHWPRSKRLHVDGGGQRTGNHQRNERPRLKLEQQQLDGENHSGDRGVEGRRHARRRAASQQDFALRSRRMKYLTYQRSEGAAGLDDRTFRSEWSTSTNGNRSRQRLQDRHARLDPAAVEHDRFHRFRNSVPLDLRRAVLGHQPDDEAANHRDHNDPGTQVTHAGTDEGGFEPMEEEQVSKKSDQLVENPGDATRQQANTTGQEGNQYKPKLRRPRAVF